MHCGSSPAPPTTTTAEARSRVASERAIASLDPAIFDELLEYPIHAVTYDGLVGYRKSGGQNGVAVVADLAISLPQVSDDGLTFRFALRPDVRFSTGQDVVPRGLPAQHRTLGVPQWLRRFAVRRDPRRQEVPARARDVRPVELDPHRRTRRSPSPCRDRTPTCSTSSPCRSAASCRRTTPVRDRSRDRHPWTTGPYRSPAPTAGASSSYATQSSPSGRSAAQPDGYVDAISWTFGQDPAAAFDRLLLATLT